MHANKLASRFPTKFHATVRLLNETSGKPANALSKLWSFASYPEGIAKLRLSK